MSEHDTEPADETTTAPSGVRVPNVRPTAVSGLDHNLLNPDDAAAAEAAEAPVEEEPQPTVAPGTELTSDEDGNLRTPDGTIYDGPVTESAPGTEPLVTTAIDAPAADGESGSQGEGESEGAPAVAEPGPDAEAPQA